MTRVVHEVERRDPGRAAAEGHPYHPMPGHGAIRGDAGLRRRYLLWMRGDVDAPAVDAVRPAVVGAFEAVSVDDPAKGEACAAMHAQVAPGDEIVPGAPDHDVFAEKPSRDRAASGQVFDPRDRVPVVDQDRVIQHPRQGVVSSRK